MDLLTWALIAGCISLLLLYNWWKVNNYFKPIGVPADMALPFVGHFHKFLKKGFFQALEDMKSRHGPVFGAYLGSSPFVFIADADILKEILIRNFSHFHNRRGTDIDDYPLNKALTRLEGARWKYVRNTITPAFSASKMKPMSVLINNCCDNLITNMKNCIATNPDFEVKGVYGNMTLDTIAHSAFGLEIDSQSNPNSPFVEHAKAIMNMDMTSPRVIMTC